MQPGLAHVGKSSFLSQFPAAGPAAFWKPIRRLCHQTIQPLPFTSAPHGVIDLKICQDWIFHVDTLKQSWFRRFPNKQPVKLTDRVNSLMAMARRSEFFHHWKTTETTATSMNIMKSLFSRIDVPTRLERASSIIVRQIGPRRSCISYIGTRSWKIWEGLSWKKMHNVVTWCLYAISNKNQQNSSLKSPSHFGYIFLDV